MQTFTNKQIIIFAIVLGLIAGLFGNLASTKIQQWYWAWRFPPVVDPITDPGIIPTLPVTPLPEGVPPIYDFEQRWLDGKIVRVNLKENYIIIQPQFEDAEEVKIVLTPEIIIKEMKIVKRTIKDFKVGQYIALESKEDIYGKTTIELIRMIQIIPPPEPVPAL
jgi:hypothetical protein